MGASSLSSLAIRPWSAAGRVSGLFRVVYLLHLCPTTVVVAVAVCDRLCPSCLALPRPRQCPSDPSRGDLAPLPRPASSTSAHARRHVRLYHGALSFARFCSASADLGLAGRRTSPSKPDGRHGTAQGPKCPDKMHDFTHVLSIDRPGSLTCRARLRCAARLARQRPSPGPVERKGGGGTGRAGRMRLKVPRRPAIALFERALPTCTVGRKIRLGGVMSLLPVLDLPPHSLRS